MRVPPELAALCPQAGSPPQAAALVGQLGGDPLLCRMAAAYLARAGRATGIQPMISTFTGYRVEVLLRDAPPRDTAAELVVEQLNDEGLGQARTLLRLLAVLPAAPVPYRMLLDAEQLAGDELFPRLTAAHLEALFEGLTGLALIDRPTPETLVADPGVAAFAEVDGRRPIRRSVRPGQRGEDSQLLRLMQAVEQDNDKALILTTREYVLQQQRQQYEKLSDPLFDVAKVAIRPAVIPPPQRAHIFYNQLYYSPLRDMARQAANGPQRYSDLVDHPHFNPRLLHAAITATARDLGLTRRATSGVADGRGDGQPEFVDLPERLRRALDNPAQLWNHVLRHQLSDAQRDLLIVRLTLAGRAVAVATLIEATQRFAATVEQRWPRPVLEEALQVLLGDLIPSHSRLRDGQAPRVVRALDPGLADAVIDYVVQYPEFLLRLADAAITYRQVRWLGVLVGIVPGGKDASRASLATPVLLGRLFAAAERTLLTPADRVLLSSQASTPPAAPSDETAHFDNFGERLELLAACSFAAGSSPSSALADRTFPGLLKAVPYIPEYALPRLVAALRLPGLDSWRQRRTEVDVAVLRRLERPGRDAPETFASWEVMRDVIDVVPTMPAYEQHLRDLFTDFLAESLDEIETMLDAADDKGDLDVSVADIDTMSGLASRWNVAEPRLDAARTAVEAYGLIDRQPSRFIPVQVPAQPGKSSGRPDTHSISTGFEVAMKLQGYGDHLVNVQDTNGSLAIRNGGFTVDA
ncbi:hypothetical protein [Actinoplanes sp. NPDC020271]|uniref:nSTAND3 domain-containing NTPase n=1 Tax=Actinoplanes sp. NPDC020271 TaxID=3363896 RepID=UPI0037BC855F